jgi:hypothetical protein
VPRFICAVAHRACVELLVWKLRDLCDDEFNRGDDVREVNRRQGGRSALAISDVATPFPP